MNVSARLTSSLLCECCTLGAISPDARAWFEKHRALDDARRADFEKHGGYSMGKADRELAAFESALLAKRVAMGL